MVVLIIVLLVLWRIAAVIGFAFKGLLWLAVIGIVPFVGTAATGSVRHNAIRRQLCSARRPDCRGHPGPRARLTGQLVRPAHCHLR